MRATDGNGERIIEIRGLSKRFGRRTVLEDVDIRVPAGQTVALLGRSGSGKTTILRIIAGLDQATGGDLRRTGSVGIVFQESRLIPNLKVWHNVVVGSTDRGRRERAHELLAEVGLESHANHWPKSLSGGEAQRVGLARALSYEPDFLLLDEPFASLDALTRIEMQALVQRLGVKHGFGALLVTHDVEEAIALADTVMVLERGRIATRVPIDLSRPRSRADPGFLRIEEALLRRLGVDTEGLFGPSPEGSIHGR